MRDAGYKVLLPTAIPGYGFSEKSFKAGVEGRSDRIAVDAIGGALRSRNT